MLILRSLLEKPKFKELLKYEGIYSIIKTMYNRIIYDKFGQVVFQTPVYCKSIKL